ncbi:hypothetical protein GPALN_001878 [Globodera pallida]|uniref:ANK_REP_REGION domain-containing protein n=1 Tax=Globodera pallida TaxID=36090 RepID=A0A183BS13_GLOPA|nr:hypothetical protein GPALN_001878 [Globodera pallida]
MAQILNKILHFNDVVETREYHKEEEPSPNAVTEFLQMPFKAPKKGYSLGVQSASYLGVYDLVEESILEDVNSVNVSNKDGWTPLMYAAQSGNIDVCQLLLKHGAQVEAKNARGQNAFELAKSWGHKRVMELIKRSNKVGFE